MAVNLNVPLAWKTATGDASLGRTRGMAKQW